MKKEAIFVDLEAFQILRQRNFAKVFTVEFLKYFKTTRQVVKQQHPQKGAIQSLSLEENFSKRRNGKITVVYSLTVFYSHKERRKEGGRLWPRHYPGLVSFIRI